ncbi:MAG: hypothetical protein M1828_005537 [Chrysothrix sp. TS-e1954]|nr:MAG: hypothetical protein M1828_005537 [Chrysothrix sp. TS-e1954]
MDFLVGTFNTPEIYTLRFKAPSDLQVLHKSSGPGSHSWLALASNKCFLYATAWTEPPSIAAYRVLPSGTVELINSKEISGRSGYVACSKTHVYSAGGATGEVFTINEKGGLGELVQELSFVDNERSESDWSGTSVLHGDFGGLRHGAHSIDIAPDGCSLYVADIGRNCIWTYTINRRSSTSSHLALGSKHVSPRSNDGPRHATVHPNNRALYSVQEHSNMIDAFSIDDDGTSLKHICGVNILPRGRQAKDYWADEVRISPSYPGTPPKYLYASTRGLEASTNGYVSVFKLEKDGALVGDAIDCFETRTSGGIANAIEPAPYSANTRGIEYLTLTDSQEGWVSVLSFDGSTIKEVAKLKLQGNDSEVVQAATAVWLRMICDRIVLC